MKRTDPRPTQPQSTAAQKQQETGGRLMFEWLALSVAIVVVFALGMFIK